jgi:hypothetical protein
MMLRVVPQGLAAASAGIEALTARVKAAHVGAAPLVTAGVLAAVDSVSMQPAAALSVQGNDQAAVAAQGVELLGRSGVGVTESGATCVTGDAAAAAWYLGGGG